MSGGTSQETIPDWMRDASIPKAAKLPSVLVASWRMRLAVVALAFALNVAALAIYPVIASFALLLSAVAIAFVILRSPGEVSLRQKAVVLVVCVVVVCLMLAFVPSVLGGLMADPRTEGMPADVGYFASATIALGMTFLAFLAREPHTISAPWKAVVILVHAMIDSYVWTSSAQVPFLEPLAYGAIWPMAMFTVIIPFAVFAYGRHEITVPSDAWQ